MRRSLRKSVGQTSLLGKETSGPESNNVVRYKGISLRYLQELSRQLEANQVAQDIELGTLSEPVTVKTAEYGKVTLDKGSTVQVLKAERQFWQSPIGVFELPDQQDLVQLKSRLEWSIEDVCEHVVMSAVQQGDGFFLSQVGRKDVGSQFQGAFLIHARKSNFMDLVDSLCTHYANKGKDPKRTFIWFDVFCASQRILTLGKGSHPEEVRKTYEALLKSSLHEAIKLFDERLVYFNSWLDPYPIQRAWCVWEIFGSVKSEKSLELLFQPGEEQLFMDTLMTDRGKVAERIMNIQLENAQCHVSSDKRDIDEAVEEQVGYHRLNVTISGLLLKWLKSFADTMVTERRMKDGTSREFAVMLINVGAFFRDQLGMFEDALNVLEESITILRREFGEDCLDFALALRELGFVQRYQDCFELAHESYRSALAIFEKSFPGQHLSEVAEIHYSIARVFQDMGEYENALGKYEEALDVFKQMSGDKTSLRVADTLHCIGQVLNELGKLDEALETLEQVIEVYEKVYGGRWHVDVAIVLHDISQLWQDKGEYKLALEGFQESLQIKEKAFGGRMNIEVSTTLHALALVLYYTGDYEAALDFVDESMKCREKNSIGLAVSIGFKGQVLQTLGEYEESLQFFKETLSIVEGILGKDHPFYAGYLICFGETLCSLGKLEKGMKCFEEAELVLREKQVREYDCWLLCGRGVAHRLLFNLDASRSDLEMALDIRRGMGQSIKNVRVQRNQLELIRTLLALGQDADELIQELLIARMDLYPEGHIRIQEVEELHQ